MPRVIDRSGDLWAVEMSGALWRIAAESASPRLRARIFDALRGVRDCADAVVLLAAGDAFRVRDAVKGLA